MTRTKKTVLTAVLCVLVTAISLTVFFIFPTSAATSGTCGDSANEGGAESVTWVLDDNGVLTISGTGAMANYTSASKQPWYSSRTSITSIVVKDGVTKIGNYAFRESKAVTVTLGKNVTTIGDYAFYNCSAMTSIGGVDNVTAIGTYAFYNCSGLTSISLPKITKIPDYTFYGCSKLVSVTFGDVTSIGTYVFRGCSALTTVNFGNTSATAKALVIPETVTSIGNDAFYGCRLFTSAELPKTIKAVPGNLFYNCSGLTSVTLKGEITSIGASAFYYCERLYKLQFGNTPAVDYKLVIPSSVTTVGVGPFYGTPFTSSDLTDSGWTELPASIFYGCMELKEVYLPAKLTSIGSAAFEQCYDLVILQWEDGKTATEGVIEIPEGVTLGSSALRYCTSFKEIILPSTLTEIPDYLFYNCYNTEKITFKGDITAIGNDAFGNGSAVANKENLNYIDFNGTKSTNGNIVLPAKLATIGDNAFQYNGSVKSVVIPEGVTSIGQNAFLGCANLSKATFNNTSATVGANVFQNCAATFYAELPYPCSNEGAVAMREAIISSGISKGAVKIDHTDADNDGCCDVTTCYDSKENGYIIVSGGVKDIDYTYSGGLLTIIKNGTYTVSSSLEETAIEESIVISAGLDNVTLILNGLNIFTTDGQNAILVDSSAELPTKVTITLAKDSENTIRSGVGSALVGGECAVVIINGEGSLIANGGNNTSTSSSSSGGAGIEMYTDGVFIVDSGTVTANGGSGYNGGPGIGVSRNKASTRSVYIINGGKVTANGGATTRGTSTSDGKYNGPGFGGSYGMSYAYSGGAYVVNGGTLIATGGIYEGAAESTRGAGIGNYCRQIQLISGNVTAKGGSTLGDIYMYNSSSSTESYYYSYWNTVDSLTLTNDTINLGAKVKSAVIDHEAKTITLPSVNSQLSNYLGHSLGFCFYGDLVVPNRYTLTGSQLTLCYNSSLTVSEGAFVDDSLDSIIYSKGMKFAKWLCPYEGVRTDDDLFVYPHGNDETGEEYANIYSTFSIKSIYYDLTNLSDRADLKKLTKTCTDLPITIDFVVISLDKSVEFVEGYDYEVVYKNNVLPGTASYTVVPLEGGRMIGDPVTVEFTITARKLAVNKPTTVYMQAGGNALDALPKGASAIYAHIDKTPQELQNGRFIWYVDAERTTLLTNEYGSTLEAGEYTVYWTYTHDHTGFENNLTGDTALIVTAKAPQQIEIDGVGVIGEVISLFSKDGKTTSTVKFDLHSVISVNGEPITDFGELTWMVNGIAPVDGVSTYTGKYGNVKVDQNGLLTVEGMTTDTVIITLTAAETESYAEGVGQITININQAGFRLHFEGSVGDATESGGSSEGSTSSGPQSITISGVTVDHKIYDGVAVSYNGTPTATLSDGTPVIPSGEYTFTYYKQNGGDDGVALDHTPYAVGNYWLIITYSDASYKGEYKTEFIIAHREIHVQPDGTLQSGTLVDGHTVSDVVTDEETAAITKVVLKNANGDDVSENYLVIFEATDATHEHDFSESARCSECGELAPLKFYGWSLTLQDNIALNYAVDAKYFADGCYTNPSVTFTIDGRTVTVTEYNTTKYAGYYIFTMTDIAPHQMGETVSAVLSAMNDDETVTTDTATYSIKTYCYNKLNDASSSTELKKLIVDLLNYGAATQTYVGSEDGLVNADLTDEQKAFGTQEDATLETVAKSNYQTVENATVTWAGAYLTLTDAVEMKFVFNAASTEGLSVKVTTADPADPESVGNTWMITGFAQYAEGMYIVNFDGFNADQMSEVVYVTVYDSEGNAISNTYCYSIESYAYAKSTDANTNLAALVKAMMKYGDSAKQYNS